MLEIAPLAVAGIDLATGTAPFSGTINGLAVMIAPAAMMARWSLRARDAAVLASALGRTLPDRIGTALDGVAQLGPDEWYALLPDGTMLPDAAGQPLSVVDVSSRAVGFAVTGPGAVAALMRGCPLDLAQFAPGRATRTVFETVEIQVWMTAPETFHVEVWRSFAPWLWHSLAGGIV
ncbi:sarcosine oxidase gamma subunit [Novosphingobium sp.]|uniref:sarcosine oxidase subunit gamma n=1 Tax=Novosphingobium sp. TaxID=1874826 RepID=UPI0033400FF3